MDVSERIEWEELISDSPDASEIQSFVDELDSEAGGRAIHSWLASEFSDVKEQVRFEGFCYDHERDYKGKFDCYDGDLVYEFKTKFGDTLDYAPFQDDLDQLNGYLHAMELDYGVLVYISRDDVTNVDEYLVEKFPLDE